MAQLKNTHRIFDLKEGESLTIGNNRTVTRRKYNNGFGFQCKLHGHGVSFVSIEGTGEIAKVTLNDCGYLTRTTAEAMKDFARAFGCTLSVSIAGGVLTLRFKNGAGHYVERQGESGDCLGPYAMGRYT
jgi:hypothetical protein